MSEGRNTQGKLNLLLWLMCALVLGLISVMVAQWRVTTLAYAMLGAIWIVVLVNMLAIRCPECRYDVTKDEEGVRTHKGWPRVNPNCANCGADIP